MFLPLCRVSAGEDVGKQVSLSSAAGDMNFYYLIDSNWAILKFKMLMSFGPAYLTFGNLYHYNKSPRKYIAISLCITMKHSGKKKQPGNTFKCL